MHAVGMAGRQDRQVREPSLAPPNPGSSTSWTETGAKSSNYSQGPAKRTEACQHTAGRAPAARNGPRPCPQTPIVWILQPARIATPCWLLTAGSNSPQLPLLADTAGSSQTNLKTVLSPTPTAASGHLPVRHSPKSTAHMANSHMVTAQTNCRTARLKVSCCLACRTVLTVSHSSNSCAQPVASSVTYGAPTGKGNGRHPTPCGLVATCMGWRLLVRSPAKSCAIA